MVLITYSRALINYGLEFLHEREYTPLQTPQLMLREQMAKTAQLSQYAGFPVFLPRQCTKLELRFDEELYKVTGDQADKYLIAVSRLSIDSVTTTTPLLTDGRPPSNPFLPITATSGSSPSNSP